MRIVRRVGIISVAKVYALLMVIFGFIMGMIINLVGCVVGGTYGADLGLGLTLGVIGLIVESLRKRRSLGLPAYTVLCCDNLPENGKLIPEKLVFRTCLLEYN